MAFCDDRKQIRFEAPDSRSHYEGRDTIEISHNQKRGMRRRRRESESMQNQRECWAGRGDKRQLMHNVCRSSLWVTILYCVCFCVCVCVCPSARSPTFLPFSHFPLARVSCSGWQGISRSHHRKSVSVCLSVCLSVYLSVCLSACLCICMCATSLPSSLCVHVCIYARVSLSLSVSIASTHRV